MRNVHKAIGVTLSLLIVSAVAFAQAFFGAPPQTPAPKAEPTITPLTQEAFQAMVNKLGQENMNALTVQSKKEFGPALSKPLPTVPEPKGLPANLSETPKLPPTNSSPPPKALPPPNVNPAPASASSPESPPPPDNAASNMNRETYTGFGNTTGTTTTNPSQENAPTPGFKIQY